MLVLTYVSQFRPIVLVMVFGYSALTSWFNGFASGKVMKFFGATDWSFAACAAAVCFPFYSVSIFMSVDIVEFMKKAANTTPPILVFLLSFIWLLLAVPLSINGSYASFKQERAKSLRVNSMKRRIPDLPWYLDERIALPIFGAIIFASIFGEFQYVMKSVWRSQLYAMFGFLLINVQLMTIIVGLLSIIQTYLLLNA